MPPSTIQETPALLTRAESRQIVTRGRASLPKLTDKSPEARRVRKRLRKLSKIIRLERAATGEEVW